MKRVGIIVALLIGIMLMSELACTAFIDQPTVVKPSVGYVPQGWSLTEDSAYGTYTDDLDNAKIGVLQFTGPQYEFVEIRYREIPDSLKGRENNPDALTDWAIDMINAFGFDAEEVAIDAVAGQMAGYVLDYVNSIDGMVLVMVFIADTTCVEILSAFDATDDDLTQVESLIYSISL